MKKTYACSSQQLKNFVIQAAEEKIAQLAVGCVLFNQDKKILTLKRKPQDFMGGIWELPSGKVKKNETLEVACAREFHEETGFFMKNIKAYLGAFDYLSSSGSPTRQFHFLITTHNHCLDPIHHPEHEDYCWVTLEDITHKNLNFTQNVRDVMYRAIDHI